MAYFRWEVKIHLPFFVTQFQSPSLDLVQTFSQFKFLLVFFGRVETLGRIFSYMPQKTSLVGCLIMTQLTLPKVAFACLFVLFFSNKFSALSTHRTKLVYGRDRRRTILFNNSCQSTKNPFPHHSLILVLVIIPIIYVPSKCQKAF